MTTVAWILLGLTTIPALYWFTLAVASLRPTTPPAKGEGTLRFLVLVPAHDEEAVIGRTVLALRSLDYPASNVEIHVVADRCGDATAARARAAGANVHEREAGDGPGSKGTALAWLLERVPTGRAHAVAVFDADSRVDPGFLRAVEPHLANGSAAVQGRHVIANPDDGPLAAMVAANFAVDNRVQNQGRANLGLSAKNMGDGICLRTELAETLDWLDPLTEDHALQRQILALGHRIDYEPGAITRGHAPADWRAATRQRARWISGRRDGDRSAVWELAKAALRKRSGAALDGAVRAVLPAYSTTALVAGAGLMVALAVRKAGLGGETLVLGWVGVVALVLAVPVLALLAEGASRRLWAGLLLGPWFALWRAGIAVGIRLGGPDRGWYRTRRASAGLRSGAGGPRPALDDPLQGLASLPEVPVPRFPEPLDGELWGVVAFFNPARYSNKLENLNRFAERARSQGLRLLVVELAFEDAPFEVPDLVADRVVRRRTRSVLWQKERLLNIGIEALPRACDRVAWLDGDVLFANPDWVAETASLLCEYRVVQPYQAACWMPEGMTSAPLEYFTPGNQEGQALPGMGFAMTRLRDRRAALQNYFVHGHLGFAWAARRSVLEPYGLYDAQILGNGDFVIAHSMYGDEDFFEGRNWQCSRLSPKMLRHITEWGRRFHGLVESSVYWVPGPVLHLWHGNQRDRQYNSRLDVLKAADFDPEVDLALDDDGCWSWASERPELHEWARSYFRSRREESTA